MRKSSHIDLYRMNVTKKPHQIEFHTHPQKEMMMMMKKNKNSSISQISLLGHQGDFPHGEINQSPVYGRVQTDQ